MLTMFVLLVSALQANALELGRGVHLDETHGQIVRATPDLRVEALGLADGKSMWISQEAAFPLVVHGERVLAIGDRRLGSPVPVVILDAENGQRSADCGVIELPDWAAGIMDGLGNSTTFRGHFAEGSFWVVWHAESGYAGGAQISWEEMQRRKIAAEGALRCTYPSGEGGSPLAKMVDAKTVPSAMKPLPGSLAEQVVVRQMGGSGEEHSNFIWAGDRLQSIVQVQGPAAVLRLHDPDTGAVLNTVTLHEGATHHRGFSADGEHALVTWADGGSYRTELFALPAGTRVQTPPDFGDGSGWVVSGSVSIGVAYSTIASYDLIDGQKRWEVARLLTRYTGHYPP
jgi:hypothetical protein